MPHNYFLSILYTFSLFFIVSNTNIASAQVGTPGAASDIVQEMQKYDSDAAQAFKNAMQKGDFETAKKVFEDYKKSRKEPGDSDAKSVDPKITEQLNQAIKSGDLKTARSMSQKIEKARKKKPTGVITLEDLAEEYASSLFERTLSGDFPTDVLSQDLKQFGYDLFQQENLPIAPAATTPVGPDYLIGPGDQFTITLWGTAEGIFNLIVAKEGNVTLPKVGVVPVAGVRFGDLENTLRRHLSKYYTNFNISVAMGKLKMITIYLVGEVANPGSYSLSGLTTVYGSLMSAGGPTKKGTLRNVQVLRNGKIIKTVDIYDLLLRGDRSRDVNLQHEDTIFVPLIGSIAGVSGAVYRPAIYELKGHETIGNLLQLAGGIMPIALSGRIQITRFSNNKEKTFLDIKLSSENFSSEIRNADSFREEIRNMDVISVLPVYDKIWETVNLQGDVRHPGDFEWRKDLKLKEIILQGALLPTSDRRRAEVIRLTEDFMDRKVIPIDLDALIAGDDAQNILLSPKDLVRVYTTYRPVEKVSISGEVVRPGDYEIYKGERLSEFMRRVGGFMPEAYPYGALFKRKDVKASQTKSMQNFITKMQTQLVQSAASGAATALSSEEVGFLKSEMALNQSNLENMKNMQEQMEGRVAINITENIDAWAGTKDDLLLQNGDSLHIPKRPQEVTVMGEIHSPGAQVYVPGLRVKHYIDRSGGLTSYADDDEIYVLKANGFAFNGDSPSVGNIEKVEINPGDTIFVPTRMERYAIMRFTRDIVDIVFKSAVVLATITVLF